MEEDCLAHQVQNGCPDSNPCSKVLSEARQGQTEWRRRRCLHGRTRRSCRSLHCDGSWPTEHQAQKTDYRHQAQGHFVGRRQCTAARKEDVCSTGSRWRVQPDTATSGRGTCTSALCATIHPSIHHHGQWYHFGTGARGFSVCTVASKCNAYFLFRF